ncbi:MAG TPA: nucleotidyltransferase domain-containing protein [Fimbriimonas sp.]|nr:nucleotidyltransferase domain-containing protein [Fimbriimonas sp.]
MFLFGASQPMSDMLIQNPQLATLVLDTGETAKELKKEAVLAEGSRLLAAATSSSYAFDRLRYLKQRFNLPIVLNDLSGRWPQEQVWKALSDLADGLIELAIRATWPSFASGRNLPEEPPISVVAFGKLGAREVNYSSDIDLVYVAADGLDEKAERECSRYCESLGRVLSDKMGRGSLYRVDLRLRPYGAAGPILRSVTAYEAYYRLYAEPWEIQALLKSRVVAGMGLKDRWLRLVRESVYQRRLSDASLEEMLEMRRRIEEGAKGDDLKRGAGGIRDVEFLCQTLQMVHGFEIPELQTPATCDALRALAEAHVLQAGVASALLEGYTFLRKLEHRTQLVGDRQTHSIPEDDFARERLAKLMGLDDWQDLSGKLNFERRTILSLYRSILRQEPKTHDERQQLGEQLGELAPAFWHWFDVFPEAEAFYRSIAENQGSMTRVRQILDNAPRLVSGFKSSLQLTELLLSGEIEELAHPEQRIDRLPPDASDRQVAETYSNANLTSSAQWALGGPEDLETVLVTSAQAVVKWALAKLEAPFDVLALGSFGTGDMGPGSDADLLFLTKGDHAAAETVAQKLLGFLSGLKRFGFDLEVDLRLRPEGGKGLLVRTYDGFGAYEVSDMEMWERFALGHARLVSGNPDALDLVRRAAYALPLTSDRVADLASMKRRIELERVKPQHIQRDVKLGHGSLNDLEWIVHLLEMRYPERVEAGKSANTVERIKMLGRSGLFNAFEVDALLAARRHLLDVRTWIYLLQFPADLVPENPDRLTRLARAMGLSDANEFLRQHEPIVSWVRHTFLTTLDKVSR